MLTREDQNGAAAIVQGTAVNRFIAIVKASLTLRVTFSLPSGSTDRRSTAVDIVQDNLHRFWFGSRASEHIGALAPLCCWLTSDVSVSENCPRPLEPTGRAEGSGDSGFALRVGKPGSSSQGPLNSVRHIIRLFSNTRTQPQGNSLQLQDALHSSRIRRPTF